MYVSPCYKTDKILNSFFYKCYNMKYFTYPDFRLNEELKPLFNFVMGIFVPLTVTEYGQSSIACKEM